MADLNELNLAFRGLSDEEEEVEGFGEEEELLTEETEDFEEEEGI